MKMSVLQEINQNVRNMKPLEYSILAGRLSQIKEELRQVKKKKSFFISMNYYGLCL